MDYKVIQKNPLRAFSYVRVLFELPPSMSCSKPYLIFHFSTVLNVCVFHVLLTKIFLNKVLNAMCILQSVHTAAFLFV